MLYRYFMYYCLGQFKLWLVLLTYVELQRRILVLSYSFSPRIWHTTDWQYCLTTSKTQLMVFLAKGRYFLCKVNSFSTFRTHVSTSHVPFFITVEKWGCLGNLIGWDVPEIKQLTLISWMHNSEFQLNCQSGDIKVFYLKHNLA